MRPSFDLVHPSSLKGEEKDKECGWSGLQGTGRQETSGVTSEFQERLQRYRTEGRRKDFRGRKDPVWKGRGDGVGVEEIFRQGESRRQPERINGVPVHCLFSGSVMRSGTTLMSLIE